MGGSGQWGPQIQALSDRFDIVAVDLPGFGANADLPVIGSIVGFAEWVIAELRRKGISRYHLLGHSMGGMIVQEIARLDHAHIDRLVLYATGAVGVLPGRFETIAESKRRAQADGAVATGRRISATWFMDRDAAAAYPDCAAIAEQATLDAIMAGLDAMQSWSGDAHLPNIPLETLVIWGDGDRTYQWPQIERLWTSIPRAGLAVVPGCAHAVHLEKPEIFNAVLADFLSDAP